MTVFNSCGLFNVGDKQAATRNYVLSLFHRQHSLWGDHGEQYQITWKGIKKSWNSSKNKPFCYIACVFLSTAGPIHWLVHCHMTFNNETVYRQMPRPGSIAKTMALNRKQFPVRILGDKIHCFSRSQSFSVKYWIVSKIFAPSSMLSWSSLSRTSNFIGSY